MRATPTKPIPQHPKTPAKLGQSPVFTRVSPAPKRGGSTLQQLIDVVNEKEKNEGKTTAAPGSQPGMMPKGKNMMVSIQLPSQVQESANEGQLRNEQAFDSGEARGPSESTLVKLSIPQTKKGEEDREGKRGQPEEGEGGNEKEDIEPAGKRPKGA